MLTATHKAMGYKATEAGGKFTIHQVEIFCACNRDGDVFDDAWIKKAVANAMQQQRGGYLPPLHVRHHEPSTDANDSVRAAGVFQITGTAPIMLKGGRRTAIMANLIITDSAIKDEILDMRLPYRSVEIFDIDNPAIDGLALLDHEAPFLELPMLMVAQLEAEDQQDMQTADTVIPGVSPGTLVRMTGVTIRRSWLADRIPGDGPVVAFLKSGKHLRLLFRMEKDMTKTEDKAEEKLAQENFAEDDKKDKDDDKSKNMEEDEGGDGGLDVSGVVKAIESGAISIADMDLILAAIQSQGAEPEEEKPVEEQPAPAMAPGAAAMKKVSSEHGVQMAAMQGRLDAMEAKGKDRDAGELRNTDVAFAMKRLAGRALGSDPEAKLVKYHEDFGPKAFKAYVDSFAETFGVLPRDNDPVQFTANDPKTPKCVQKFYKDGPDEGEKAAKLAANHAQLVKQRGTSLALDRYVEVGMMDF